MVNSMGGRGSNGKSGGSGGAGRATQSRVDYQSQLGKDFSYKSVKLGNGQTVKAFVQGDSIAKVEVKSRNKRDLLGRSLNNFDVRTGTIRDGFTFTTRYGNLEVQEAYKEAYNYLKRAK